MSTDRPIAVITPVFPVNSDRGRSCHGLFIYNTVRSLAKHSDVEVFWIRPVFPGTHSCLQRLDAEYGDLGARVFSVSFPYVRLLCQPWSGVLSGRALISALRGKRPSVLLAYWLYPTGFGAVQAAQAIGCPVVLGALGSDLLRIPYRFIHHRTRKALLGADRIITVSADLQNRAVGLGVPEENVRTVLNGVDREVFHRADRDAARRTLGLSSDAKLAVTVGWLTTMKGAPDLMTVMEILASKRHTLELCFIGTGELERQLRDRAAKAGLEHRVHLTGRLTPEEVAVWLAASDVFAFPSYSEGCPNAVIEALSCGRPIVAYNVGGIPELLNDNNGRLVPLGDVDAFAVALDQTLEKTWDSSLIESTYCRTWDDVAADTLEVLASVSA